MKLSRSVATLLVWFKLRKVQEQAKRTCTDGSRARVSPLRGWDAVTRENDRGLWVQVMFCFLSWVCSLYENSWGCTLVFGAILFFVKGLPKKGLVKCLRTWGTASAGKKGPLGLSFKLFELRFFLWKMGTSNSSNLKLQLRWVSWIESNSNIVNASQILVHYN